MVGELRPGDNAVFTVIRDRQPMDIQVRTEARTDQVASDNRRLWPGVTVIPLTGQIMDALDLTEAKGLYVAQVISGTPADIIGLRQGDRITAVNGAEVSDMASFYKLLRERTATELWFDILRADATLETLRFRR
jgi:S1-C subfamily serine protease